MTHLLLLCTALVAGAAAPAGGATQQAPPAQAAEQGPGAAEEESGWREVRPSRVNPVAREADLDHGVEKPPPARNPHFRGWMLFLGGLSTAAAILLWAPLLAIGPPTLLAVGLNAIASVAALARVKDAAGARLRVQAWSERMRRYDFNPAWQAARKLNVGLALLAVADTLRRVDLAETYQALRRMPVRRWVSDVERYDFNYQVNAQWWLDPRVQAVAIGVAAVVGVMLVAGALLTVTLLPPIFFAASFLAGDAPEEEAPVYRE